jgi:hypothetical protein
MNRIKTAGEVVFMTIDQMLIGIESINPPAFVVFSDGEMLRIANDGFYVRGVKLPQDENEAKAVYDAVIAFLTTVKAFW